MMREQYLRTFFPAQAGVLLLTSIAWYRTNSAAATAAIFLTAQVANVLGAWWAARLKRGLEQRLGGLPRH